MSVLQFAKLDNKFTLYICLVFLLSSSSKLCAFLTAKPLRYWFTILTVQLLFVQLPNVQAFHSTLN